jgi:hypothetical protein
MYPFLAYLFFLNLLIFVLFVFGFVFKPKIWRKNRAKLKMFGILWFTPYFIFILCFTGENSSIYPPNSSSPYKLPWKAGVTRFVAQGNKSFTSHRGSHEFAWDFVMPNGTEILAARNGRVLNVNDGFEGIGLDSNAITIEHEDGQKSAYAHIRYHGALVKVGEFVKQGQPIALSGMVGQTIFPHVHFLVFNKESTTSIPISFSDVPGGVPLAGRFYTSENIGP